MAGLSTLTRLVRRLKRRTAREREGLFLLEGPHLVGEALRSGLRLEGGLYTPAFAATDEARTLSSLLKADFAVVDERTFLTLAETKTPQGILAIAHRPGWGWEDLWRERAPLVVVSLGLQDPGNLGAIVRSAEAAGASGLVLASGSVDPFNPKVVRAAMGSLFRLPVLSAVGEEWAQRLRAHQIRLLAAHPRGERELYQTDLTGPVAFLLGNEGAGIGERDLSLADELIQIPLAGPTESLNVAAAAAVLFFETLRQRRLKS